jgi:hypothetical protein
MGLVAVGMCLSCCVIKLSGMLRKQRIFYSNLLQFYNSLYFNSAQSGFLITRKNKIWLLHNNYFLQEFALTYTSCAIVIRNSRSPHTFSLVRK